MKTKYLTAKDIEAAGKKILVRGDLDVDDGDNPRVSSVRGVIELLIDKKAEKIKIIGHRETNFDICAQLRQEFPDVEFDDKLRANPGEKTNDPEFAMALAADWDIYINEAFATSHRKHCSIDALPRVMKAEGKIVGIGEQFALELVRLDKVWKIPGKRILVIGGVKIDDKEKFAEEMKDKFAAVLKGGLLPGVDLRPDGLDISDKAIEEYKNIIATAEVVLAAGVMGKYEYPNCAKGTKEVLEAIANSKAYKVAGGGDIEMAISTYGLTDKFDWISVGGGAMLVYLHTGTLPGIEAIG